MTCFASFAAFGLGYSSTKLISGGIAYTKGYSRKALLLSVFISFVVCVILMFISKPIAVLLDKPELETFFLYVAILFSLKAVWTVANGILSGYKMFKQISIINIVSSFVTFLLIYPMTALWGLKGAIIDLIIYQTMVLLLCYLMILKKEKTMALLDTIGYKRLFQFTIPIALHEISFTISSIASVMIILKFSSYGEYGIYAIALQWNYIIIIIPTLLMNVTLSYLSSSSENKSHTSLIKKMLLLNFICTLVPMVIVYLASGIIVDLYGSTFGELLIVLRICVFSTLLSSLILVFQSNLISEGRNWNLAIYKLVRDSFSVFLLYSALESISESSALIAVIVDAAICFFYLLILSADYIFHKNSEVKSLIKKDRE